LSRLTKEEQQKALEMAMKMADDFDAGQAERFGQKHSDKPWFKHFKLLYDLITDPTFKLSPSLWAVIAGALAYVIMPIDVVPDFIPVLGWIDDAFVLTDILARLPEEIRQYKLHIKSGRRISSNKGGCLGEA
jgi:uncharacterized membrane protein YkvA (DUF1232 family)